MGDYETIIRLRNVEQKIDFCNYNLIKIMKHLKIEIEQGDDIDKLDDDANENQDEVKRRVVVTKKE